MLAVSSDRRCIFVNLVQMKYLNLADDISNGETEAHHL
jgi:hypothetical protein